MFTFLYDVFAMKMRITCYFGNQFTHTLTESMSIVETVSAKSNHQGLNITFRRRLKTNFYRIQKNVGSRNTFNLIFALNSLCMKLCVGKCVNIELN